MTTVQSFQTAALQPPKDLATIPARVRQNAELDPLRTCLVQVDGVGDDRSLTYAQTWTLVEVAVERLRSWGVRPADKVALLSPNDIDVIIATLAILEIGAVWLPVNSRESVETMCGMLDQFGCDLLLAHQDLAETARVVETRVPTIRGRLTLAALTGPTDDVPRGAVVTTGDGDPLDISLGAIFPTGGTTGRPKGVSFTHERLAALAWSYQQVIAEPDDIYLAAAPLTHVGGRTCLSAMTALATVVILPGFDEDAVLRAISEHGITTITITSTMLYRLLDHPDLASFNTSSLRSVVYGAGPTAPRRIRQAIDAFGPVLVQGYGQTEAPMFMTRLTAADHMAGDAPAPEDRLLTVGRSTAVSDIVVAGDDGTPLATGSVGNILVRGPFTMSGYYKNPEATEQRRVGEYQNTGDRGRLDVDGFLTIVGRQSDLIISGGFNVYPAEVEHALSTLPGVKECAVFGIPDDKWGECIVAAVSLYPGVNVEADELRSQVRPVLGGVKTPKYIHVVDAIPRNDTGKILKRQLAEDLHPS
jgi:acyl-CoA synthetase (AMP-forming)/AMP-acid ligase II